MARSKPVPALRSAPLARRLKKARERLGLSVREMGRLTGIPWASVAALERGREPRWSTLMRYLEHVPGLRASELLPPPLPVPPAVSASVHAFLRQAYSLSAESVSVTLTVRKDGSAVRETRVQGVRWLGAPGPRAVILPRLLQAAAPSVAAVLRSLLDPPLDRSVLRFADGAARHELRVSRADDDLVVDRRTVETLEQAPEEVRLELKLPADIIEMTVVLPRSRAAEASRLLAWPKSRATEGEDADAFRYLHPEGVPIEHDGGRRRARLTLGMPDVVYALRWSAAGDEPREQAAPPAPRTFAPIARRLRAASGLSGRELARRMGVSHVTIVEAERGRDVRVSTLAAYVASVPDTAPQALLPARGPEVVAGLDEAWEWYRDLHQLELGEMEQITTVHPEGHRETAIRMIGLRSFRPGERGVKLLRAVGDLVFSREMSKLVALATDKDEDQDEVRARRLTEQGSQWSLEISIPGRRSRNGISLSHVVMNPGKFALTLQDGFAVHGSADPDIIIGGNAQASLPTRKLAYEFRLPSRARVRDPFPVCKPSMLLPGRMDTGWLERLHHRKHRVEVDLAAGRFRLEVERPLCGFNYGFGVYLA